MRNLSVNKLFQERAGRHTPAHHFTGRTAEDWRAWRDVLTPQIGTLLGRFPPRCDMNPELIAEWQEDGLIKQRIIIDVEPGLSAVLYLFRPQNQPDRPRPLILCCHGHGPHGKEALMGHRDRVSAEMRAHIDELNYNYGLQMAQAGFVTLTLDWRGFGDRDDRAKPHWWNGHGGRDLCNLHYLRASMFGESMLAANVSDAIRAIDYACSQPWVNTKQVGVMGLSLGGTMAMWISLIDERIQATNIICYSDRFTDFGFRDVNFCGNQIVHGLYELVDLPDLQGLLAPRPLLVEIGTHDECFRIESAMSCYRKVEQIYQAAGVPDRLELDLFEGGHAWGGNKSVSFFQKWLNSAATKTTGTSDEMRGRGTASTVADM